MDVRWIILTFLAANAGICLAGLALQPEGSKHAYFTLENFIMTCSALGNHTTKLRWHGPSGDEITDSSGRIHVEEGIGHVELRLVWESVEREDAGIYKCIGNADDDEISFELIVYGSIDFSNVENDQRGREGDNLTVVCDADGEPKPTISWRFKDVVLSQKDVKYEAEGNELRIYNLKRDDAGDYTCNAMIVADIASQLKDTHIRVHVEYAPEWKGEKPGSSFSRIGHVVNLTCEADAEPSPVFLWKRSEGIIQPSNFYLIHNQNDKTILEISVLNESFFGDYECIAENPLGNIKKIVVLEEGDAPSAPSFQISSDEPGTLTLSIDPPPETMLKVTCYKVEYKLPSESWNSVQTIEFERGHQYTLKNLMPDTDYVVRVAAKNEVGYGEYSIEITKRTKSLSVDANGNSAFCIQSSAVAALLSTSVSLWVLRL